MEATLLFSVKHQKGKDTPTSRNRLHRNLAYFRQRQSPRCRTDHTQKVTGRYKLVKNDHKKWEKIKFGSQLYGFCWGGSAKTDPLFCEKTYFIPLAWYITIGGSVLLTKHNVSKSCIFTTLVGKGLMEAERHYVSF